MTWRQLAQERLRATSAEDKRDKWDNSPPLAPAAPVAVIVPPSDHGKLPTKPQARATLRDWHRKLSGLDFDTAPPPLTLQRWRRLVEDAHWLYENHAPQLVREGWSAHDVFGVLLSRPEGGALLDRLDGSRNLRLDGKGRAAWGWVWSSVIMQSCRGAGDCLVPNGLVPVWELHGND